MQQCVCPEKLLKILSKNKAAVQEIQAKKAMKVARRERDFMNLEHSITFELLGTVVSIAYHFKA